MEIYFPVAGLSVNLFTILGLGGGIGLLSGIIGVGGGLALALARPNLRFPRWTPKLHLGGPMVFDRRLRKNENPG